MPRGHHCTDKDILRSRLIDSRAKIICSDTFRTQPSTEYNSIATGVHPRRIRSEARGAVVQTLHAALVVAAAV
jgi:hypothetical protein